MVLCPHENFDWACNLRQLSNVLFLWTDIALKILEKDVTLGTKKDKKTIAALRELAKKPFVIGGKSRLSLWERCFNFG